MLALCKKLLILIKKKGRDEYITNWKYKEDIIVVFMNLKQIIKDY